MITFMVTCFFVFGFVAVIWWQTKSKTRYQSISIEITLKINYVRKLFIKLRRNKKTCWKSIHFKSIWPTEMLKKAAQYNVFYFCFFYLLIDVSSRYDMFGVCVCVWVCVMICLGCVCVCVLWHVWGMCVCLCVCYDMFGVCVCVCVYTVV